MLFVEALGVVVPSAALPFIWLGQLLLEQVQLQRRTGAGAREERRRPGGLLIFAHRGAGSGRANHGAERGLIGGRGLHLEHGLGVRGVRGGEARQVDRRLGQQAGASRREDGGVTWGESWVVGQDDGHDGSHVRVHVLGRRHRLQVVEVLYQLNGLHLDGLHARQVWWRLDDAEVVTELGLVGRLQHHGGGPRRLMRPGLLL